MDCINTLKSKFKVDIELKPQIEVAKVKLRSIVSILSTVCFSRPRCR